MKEMSTPRQGARGGVKKRWWARVVLVLAGLLALYGVANFTAHHVADSLTVTVTHDIPQSSPKGTFTTQMVFTTTITDGAKARAVQSLLNNVRLAPFRASFVSCPGGGFNYTYSFQFSFLGLPVQETQFRMVICQLWHMTTLGLPSPVSHMIPTPDTWVQIERLTSMPDYRGYQHISLVPARVD